MTEADGTRINDLIPAMHDGFRLHHYDGWKLVIAGSQDHCYYRNVEIICHGLIHVNMSQSLHLERVEIINQGDHELMKLYDDENNVRSITAERIEMREVLPSDNDAAG